MATAEEVATSMAALEDEDLLASLQTVLQERTGVLQALVDWAVPSHVYIPSKAITEHRIQGMVKSYSPKDGYGFVACDEVRDVFGCDVFLHGAQINALTVGDHVNFAVLLNREQKPQAFDISLGEPGSWKSKQGDKGEKGEKGAPAWSPQPAWQSPSPPMKGGYQKGGYEKGGFEKGSYTAPAPAVAVWADPWSKGYSPPMKGAAKGGGGMKGPPSGGKGPSTPSGPPPGTSMDMPGVTDRRFEGAVKSFNHQKGFGFLVCEELSAMFGGSDTFVHHQQITSFMVGDPVEFSVILNKDQKPQAMDLRPMGAAKRAKH